MLIDLRDYQAEGDDREARTLENAARRCFASCLDIAVGKLEAITVLHVQRGTVDVVNFLKLHFDPAWTCEKLRGRLKELYGFGKRDQDQPGAPRQLTFAFDVFGECAEDDLADIMEADGFCLDDAMAMAYNGAVMCAHANRYLESHVADFDDAELDTFDVLLSRLDDARGRIASVLQSRRRRQLAIGQ